jgi:hypothetical protein
MPDKLSPKTLFNKLTRSASDKLLLPELVASVEVGDTDVEVGDTAVEVGDADVEVGDTDVEVGDTDVEVGDTDVEVGDTDVEVGDTDVGVLDTAVEVGDTAFEVCTFFEAQAAPADAVNDIINRTASKMPSVCFIL